MLPAGAGEVWQLCTGRALDRSVQNQQSDSLLSYDITEEYYQLMLEHGYDVKASYRCDEFGKTCLSKYLHMLECDEINRLGEVLKQTPTEKEHVELMHELITSQGTLKL